MSRKWFLRAGSLFIRLSVKCWRVEVRTVLTRVGARETQRLDPLAGTQQSDAITITIAATPSPLQNVRDYCLPVFRAINVPTQYEKVVICGVIGADMNHKWGKRVPECEEGKYMQY
jgi:hypothetical protein